MSEWISVKDGLPGMLLSKPSFFFPHGRLESEAILARFDFRDGTSKTIVTKLRSTFWSSDFSLGWLSYAAQFFTYWMPLPSTQDTQAQEQR